MTEWDAPNQQAVRPDESPPWEEGQGGSTPAPPANELDSMTKDELLAYAADHDVEADSSMTKADIRAAIDAGGGP